VLDSLAQQIVKAGIFRSLMVALVDEATHSVEVVRSFICQYEDGRVVPGTVVRTSTDVIGLRYDLDDANVTAVTARTGELQVIDGWTKQFDSKIDLREGFPEKASYFIPVKKDDRVLAVLATASPPEQKAEILQRIEVMRPLLGQVAISIDHARLFRDAQDHAREWVRMERVRAIGEMAEGIAHNFNNMLTAILGHAELSKLHNIDPVVEEEIDLVVSATLRASELVKRLRGSARREDRSHLYAVDLNEAVEQAVEGTRPMWKDRSEAGGIAITVDMQLNEVPAIGGTESETFDMLTNLLLNAVDAMPKGGSVTILTKSTDGGVVLVVRDTGIGLDEETRKRIFEPLFTTKSNVGSGLGLTTVQGTLNRWGGHINVRSSPGEGAEFEMFLPTWKESSVTEEPRKPPPDELSHSEQARVLVVDDEPAVCAIISSFVAKHHKVATFLNPREAQAQFKAGDWDVAIIDLGMPEVPGDELARSLKRIDPDLVTVLSTGWGIEADDPRLGEFDWRLEKPFRKSEVEGVILQALQKRKEKPRHP
jgi:signal transduction histidine kinase/CheY-like chemotaxis protein